MKGSSSYPPCARQMPNMKFIRKHGIDEFMRQQTMRMAMLQVMIERYDDGRSKSLYCRTAALLDVAKLECAIAEAERKIRTEGVKQSDRKSMAKTLKATLE